MYITAIKTPHVSILAAGGIMTLPVPSVDSATLVAVSTFAQLLLYEAANVSALRLKTSARLYPRPLPAIGLGTCVLLIIHVGPSAFAVGLACLITGAAYYVIKAEIIKHHDTGYFLRGKLVWDSLSLAVSGLVDL